MKFRPIFTSTSFHYYYSNPSTVLALGIVNSTPVNKLFQKINSILFPPTGVSCYKTLTSVLDFGILALQKFSSCVLVKLVNEIASSVLD